jgi:hypothetical protein
MKAFNESQTKVRRNVIQPILYNTLLNSDRLIGCLWSRDNE